jgi:hypothetical protein
MKTISPTTAWIFLWGKKCVYPYISATFSFILVLVLLVFLSSSISSLLLEQLLFSTYHIPDNILGTLYILLSDPFKNPEE